MTTTPHAENGQQPEQPATEQAAADRRARAKQWFDDHIGQPPKFRPVAEERMSYARHGDYTHSGQRPIRRTLGVLGGRIDLGKKAILCYFDWLTEPERIVYSLIATFVLTNAAAQIPYVGDLIAYVPVLHYFDVQSWFG